jgi:8-oxo-dGTP pyrophosphatase MutT (NUDIX family)
MPISVPLPDAGHGATAGDSSRPGGSFRQLDEQLQLEGWRIRVVKATFETPDGEVFTRDVVRHPGAVAVVPVTDANTALLVRQYRAPVDRELIEIPAGTRDVEGEPPEQTALRELTEEVGVSAGEIKLIATVLNTPGFCDEQTLVFLATDLRPAEPTRQGQEERFIEVVEVPLGDVDELVASGRLSDAQTVIGLLLARDAIARDGGE